MHICHPGTQAPEAGGSQVQGQPCYVVSLSRLEEKKRWRGGGSHCCSLRRASCSESGVFFFFSFFILLVKTPYGYLSQYLAHRVSFCCGVGEHLIFFLKYILIFAVSGPVSDALFLYGGRTILSLDVVTPSCTCDQSRLTHTEHIKMPTGWLRLRVVFFCEFSGFYFVWLIFWNRADFIFVMQLRMPLNSRFSCMYIRRTRIISTNL